MITIEFLTPEHFEAVANWLSDHEINQWLSGEWRGRTVDPVAIGIVVRNKKNRLYLVRYNNEPCGLVALADWDSADNLAMVWYLLGKAPLGSHGIITEAVRQLIELSCTELGIESLYAWIMEDNTRSRRVLEKAGFKEVGRLRRAARRGERQLDRVYFDRPKMAEPDSAPELPG